MKFVVFVEGQTERALRPFFAKWLNAQLTQNVGIDIVHFDGAGDMIKVALARANLTLNAPKQDVIAVIGLLDLHNLPMEIPADKETVEQKCIWAKQNLKKQVNHPKFKQHFAVHETEAWLLSQPSLFGEAIGKDMEGKEHRPEEVNNQEPPAKLLDKLYTKHRKRGYKKVTDGAALFAKLDPEMAYDKCPHLEAMLDDMLQLARSSGL